MTAIGTRFLKVKIGSTEHTAEVSKCEVVSGPADSDFVSYADAAAGGKRKYTLEMTAVQDTDTASLWRYLWANAGTSVAVKVNPYGSTTATVAEPHFTGNVVITEPDGRLLGGEANSSTSARQTVDIVWEFTAKPTEVTTGAF